MVKILIGTAGLVIGLVIGFWLGVIQTPARTDVARADGPSVVSAPEPERPSLPLDRATAVARDAVEPVPADTAPAEVKPSDASEERVPDGMIRGVIVDSAGRPLAFAEIIADLMNAPDASSHGFWHPPAPWHIETRATSSGRFALGGLRPSGEYSVHTQYGRLVRADVARQSEIDDRRIVAPADGVTLTLTQCRLEVELMGLGERNSLPNGEVVVTVAGASPSRFDGEIERQFAVGVPPDHPVRVELRDAGIQPAILEDIVVSAAEATKHVTLALTTAGAGGVLLTVLNDVGSAQEDVVLDDVTRSDHRVGVDVDWSRSSRERGTFALTRLSAGPHVLLVRGPAGSGLVPARIDFNVVESAEIPVTAVLGRGGRLRVAVSAAEESFAQARIFAGDVQVEGPFVDEMTHRDIGDQLVRGQRYLFDCGLKPGNYVLKWERGSMGRIRDGSFRSLGGGPKGEVPFTVGAGELKDLEVKLD
jgi:hypothetical protein